MRIVLASASPRRREILARIAYPFEVCPTGLDESRREDESPRDYVVRLAAQKAAAVAARRTDALVVGADTAVVLGDEILGKPADAADAARMLAALSGRRHEVLSGVAIARGGEVARRILTTSHVEFRALGDGEIAQYVKTGEPLDKAGAYAVQGAAGRFVRGVSGSVTGVIGLPYEETLEAMRDLGAPAPGTLSAEAVALRFLSVRGEIAARVVAGGRPVDSVRLLTVTKGHSAEMAAAVLAAGATDIGENYVQEARAKRDVLGGTDARWHLIGPLQRNKARAAAEAFDVIHTIERAETAEALSRRLPEGRELEVLLQVNVTRDPAKSGVPPERVAPLLARVRGIPHLTVTGLMTIGRAGSDRTETAAAFAELRDLRDRLRGAGHEHLVELSMGMSQDYDAAIDQGATLVRVGTAILGPRPPRQEAERV